MIEDKEMREIFKVESGEHLQILNERLLRLERNPNEKAIIEELFREIHSLKGGARMLGLGDIEVVSHRIEDIFKQCLKHDSPLSIETIEILYQGLDAISDLVEEALSGVSSGVKVTEILARLSFNDAGGPAKLPDGEVITGLSNSESGKSTGSSEESPKSRTDAGKRALSADSQLPHSAGGVSTNPTGESFRIGTIRVETHKLDLLMTHVGELIVAKLRFSQRPLEIEEILEKWAELCRELRHSPHLETSIKDRLDRFSCALEKMRNDVSEDHSRLEFITGELEDGVRAIRLLPLSKIFCLFPRLARDLTHDQGKETDFRFEGGETAADKRILEEMKDPLMHVIRNAVDHGIELPEERTACGKPREGTIVLKAFRTESTIVLEVSDDGRGLDAEKIKRTALKQRLFREDELEAMSLDQIHSLIFCSGLSTSSFVSDISGRGVGLDVVRAKTEELKGSVSANSVAGAGCTIRIVLPVTLATARVLLLTAGGVKYALPVEFVFKSCFFPRNEIFFMEGRETVLFEGRAISVAGLADLMKFQRGEFLKKQSVVSSDGEKALPCIVLAIDQERFGLFIEDILDEQEILLKPQSGLLKHVHGISGATILGTGEVCMVLHPPDLMQSMRRRQVETTTKTEDKGREEKKIILLAEDTLTTRIQMKRILEGAGYEVVVAVDGADAFGKLETRAFDAIVSDIMMPNMDGLALTAKIRRERKYLELPIILVTSLDSGEDKRKGAEAGANAYLTKPAFDQKVLIETLRRLV